MTDKVPEGRSSQTVTFREILSSMNEEGGFQRSVLATGEGLPIAAAPNLGESESTGAMISMLQRVSQDIQEQLDFHGVDEVTIRDDQRNRLVCRGINVGQDSLILAAFVPPGQYYRRATNRAIKHIQQLVK